jgi:hypothetical protein
MCIGFVQSDDHLLLRAVSPQQTENGDRRPWGIRPKTI